MTVVFRTIWNPLSQWWSYKKQYEECCTFDRKRVLDFEGG